MIILAILSTIAAAAWSFVVVMANGMSSAPSLGFQGGWTIGAAWAVVVVFWLAWWFK